MSFDNLMAFIELGFGHILPKGLDHILFIVAICAASTGWRSLLLQATGFTIAHSVTLGLAAAGLVSIPANIVEPVIALSIAAVGLEAIFLRKAHAWRMPVIILFGLFHGLGFASQMRGFLEGADFLTALVGFNVGVELGQLVIIAGFALVAGVVTLILRRLEREELYQWVLVRPVAAIVVVAGVGWFLQRTGVLAGLFGIA